MHTRRHTHTHQHAALGVGEARAEHNAVSHTKTRRAVCLFRRSASDRRTEETIMDGRARAQQHAQESCAKTAAQLKKCATATDAKQGVEKRESISERKTHAATIVERELV